MAELKRNFSNAKMNKDMDERVLPSGQYRNALNVQVASSDGSNLGALQTILGNTVVSSAEANEHSKCVGSVTVDQTNKIYYFISRGGGGGDTAVPDIQKDFIIEYDTILQTTKFVFVDIFSAKATVSANNTGSTQYLDINTGSNNWTHGISVGMMLTGTLNDPGSSAISQLSPSDEVEVTDVVSQGGNVWRIYYSNPTTFKATANDVIRFVSERVLNFNHAVKIHSINHLEGMLFWTDGVNEPKKINIKRSLAGTGGLGPLVGWNLTQTTAQNLAAGLINTSIFPGDNGNFHTRLTKRRSETSSALEICTNRVASLPVEVREDHVTIIKPCPKKPLELCMFTQSPDRVNDSDEVNPIFATTTSVAFGDSDGPFEVGHPMTISFGTEIDLRVGDTILLVQQSSNLSPSEFALDKAFVQATVVDPLPLGTNPPNVLSTGAFNIIINSVNSGAGSIAENWFCRVELERPIFEYKFPRFSYRWRYQDGEYSTFAPWSEVAFVPGDFDYMPKKGFNLGMTNRLRYLKLKQYFPEFSALPEDIVEIDLLYKEAGKSTVYTVKTIKPSHGSPTWADYKSNYKERGVFEITSEMIHAVVPSNQLLRPWDNVPRKADTQEISSNRLIYGNYLQNYTIDETLKLQVTVKSEVIPDSKIADYEEANISVKSLRTYQIGVVWSDSYGRETPVMVPKTGGSITIPKKSCVLKNQLRAKIMEDVVVPTWAEYVSYYVKETSNEYYNLAMDRFYDAEDGNIWLSFPSAERNKVQEDTYLYLKKQHDNETAVTEKARYRVIAIENEAPLFIKKKRRSFGFETIEYQSVGLPEEGRTFIRVSKSQFDGAFGSIFGPPVLDNLQLRIGGTDGTNILTSDIYDVVSVAVDGSWVKVTIAEPLGTEVNAIAVLNATSQMKLEMFQNVFEDKPEFDGRFFVKILKDLTLEKQLLTTFEQSFAYNVVETMQVGYLNNQDGSPSHATNCTKWWCQFKQYHNGGSHTSTKNRWIIDDQDTYQPDFATDNINRGGMYNYPRVSSTSTPQAGAHGYMDISYATVGQGSGMWGEGTKFTIPWNRLKVEGTLFRFKQDPAQVVYKIIGVSGRLGSDVNAGEGAVLSGANQTPGQYNQSNTSGTWILGDNTTPPLIGSAADYAWNWVGSGGNANDDDNQRISLRIKVDKLWGSSSQHIFDDSFMAPMNVRDTPGGPLRPIVNGERYDKAVAGGTAHGTAYPFGHYHNWYPFTSDTGAVLDNANQIQSGTVYDGTHFHTANPNYGDQMQLSPLYHSTYPSLASKDSIGTGGVAGGWDQKHDITIEFLEPTLSSAGGSDETYSSANPAIWETEPKEDVGLDIYWEASGKMPLDPDHKQNELLIPLGSTFRYPQTGSTYDEYEVIDVNSVPGKKYLSLVDLKHIYNSSTGTAASPANIQTTIPHDTFVWLKRYNHSQIALYINKSGGAASGQSQMQVTTGANSINQVSNLIQDGRKPFKSPVALGWFNCWSFGNGVESDRIRDDYNAPQYDNGVKASTTLATPYEEERRSSGLIWSGIFNSTSGVNNLNQFIQAEPITKDLSPSYGPIKKLVTRDTNTLAFCEDKVLNLLTNKDALFNADGNSNVTSTNNVIGQATPINGDYGMSANPESLAVTPMAIFWCDAFRGQVLKLEGGTSITPISDTGMKDYFNDNLKDVAEVIGSWDEKKDEYNITLGYSKVTYPTTTTGRDSNGVYTSIKNTLSWSERVKGWTSFKSFAPEQGNTLNNEYYTWKDGKMYQHHVEKDTSGNTVNANYFYGTQYYSDVTLIFNDQPGSVKSFGSLNYEGTQSRVTQGIATESDGSSSDGQYVNLNTKTGWYVDYLTTDLQEVGNLEFKNKEGKWFSTIKGVTTELSNLDEREFSVQGLGLAQTNNVNPKTLHKVKFKPSTASASGTNWDTTADNPNWRIHPDSVFTDYTAGQTQGTFYWERYSGESIDPATAQGLRYLAPSYSHVTIPEITNLAEGIIDNLKDNGSGVFVYSGLDLDASDFSVPGGTLDSTATAPNGETIYKWTDDGSWNADAEVHYVTFENTAKGYDPNNTILFKAYHDTFTMPAADKVIHFDIDSTAPIIVTPGPRRLKLRVSTTAPGQDPTGLVGGHIPRVSGAAICVNDPTSAQQPNCDLSWGAPNNNNLTVSGMGGLPSLHGTDLPWTITTEYGGPLPDGLTTPIFTHTWRSYDDIIADGQGASISGYVNWVLERRELEIIDYGSGYAPYLTVTYDDIYHTGTNSNLRRGSTATVYYTPPQDPSLLPDPSYAAFSAIPIRIREIYEVLPLPPAAPTPTLLSSSITTPSPVTGTTQIITMNTNGSGKVKLIVYDVTRNKYYTTSNDTWGTGSVQNEISITGNSAAETITLPAATATENAYQYYFAASTNDPVLALASGVPITSARADFKQQAPVTTNFRFEAKTNTTRVPTLVSGFDLFSGHIGKDTGKVITVNSVYTADSSNTIALSRQPLDSDIVGGTRLINTSTSTSSGATLLRVAAADVGDFPSNETIGLSNFLVSEEATHRTITFTSGISKNDNHGVVSDADYNYAVVGMEVESGLYFPAGTTVASKAIVSGQKNIVFSAGTTIALPANGSINLMGAIKTGTKITAIANVEGAAAVKDITIAPAVLMAIPSGTELVISNGLDFVSDLTAVALPTETTSGSSGSIVVSTVYNKEIEITGTITLTGSAPVNTDLTLKPNFITVS